MSAAIDITTDSLRIKGFTVKKENKTIVVYRNNGGSTADPIRSDFYKNEWNKTVNRLEKKLEEKGIPQLTISEIDSCMASNYDKLMDGAAAATSTTTIEETPPPPLEKLDDMKPEEWQAGLMARYQTLQDTIRGSVQPLPNLVLPLEFALSVKNILNLADCTLPFAGILLGPPSSLKTVAVELFRRYWHAKYKDDFSPKAWVSHYGGVPEDELKKVDLLPLVRYKLFLTPELSPLFTGSEDDIKKAFGILTRLLDGKGLQSHSGTQGERGYYGDYMFTWIGAVVDVSARVHRLMGNLGPKMYFLRLSKSYRKEKDLVGQLENPRFVADLAKIQEALFAYLKWFEACPLMTTEKNGLPRMVWDSSGKDEVKALRYIARLAMLIGPLRGVVGVDDTEDTEGSSYGFALPIVEEPDRANQQLYNLARGHALIEGRNYVTLADIPLLIKVALSTAPITRVAILEMLLANGGTLKTADIKAGLEISQPTVHKAMAELGLLELVDVGKDGDYENSTKIITLKRQFRWCLGTRFKQLREGFVPARKARKQAHLGKRGSNRGDNMDKDSTKLKEMSGSVTHDFFWEIYDRLENQSKDKTVSEMMLRQELISSGKFDAGQAAQIIRDMIFDCKITKSYFDVISKNSQSK